MSQCCRDPVPAALSPPGSPEKLLPLYVEISVSEDAEFCKFGWISSDIKLPEHAEDSQSASSGLCRRKGLCQRTSLLFSPDFFPCRELLAV